jgi:hypothetical protein
MLFCSRCAWYNHALSQVDNQRAPRAIMSNMELTLTSPSFPFTRYVNVHSNISTMLQLHRLQYSCRMHPLITLQLLSSEPYKGSIRSYLLAISCLQPCSSLALPSNVTARSSRIDWRGRTRRRRCCRPPMAVVSCHLLW